MHNQQLGRLQSHPPVTLLYNFYITEIELVHLRILLGPKEVSHPVCLFLETSLAVFSLALETLNFLGSVVVGRGRSFREERRRKVEKGWMLEYQDRP